MTREMVLELDVLDLKIAVTTGKWPFTDGVVFVNSACFIEGPGYNPMVGIP